jgi:hypothetical protein
MAANKAISDILADPRYDDENFDESRAEAIEKQIRVQGWEPVREFLLDLLKTKSMEKHWSDAIQSLWGAVSDSRPVEAPRVIALLCRCQSQSRELDENLIWSIIAKLKKVDYLSDYDPLKDPDVQRELDRLNR